MAVEVEKIPTRWVNGCDVCEAELGIIQIMAHSDGPQRTCESAMILCPAHARQLHERLGAALGADRVSDAAECAGCHLKGRDGAFALLPDELGGGTLCQLCAARAAIILRDELGLPRQRSGLARKNGKTSMQADAADLGDSPS